MIAIVEAFDAMTTDHVYRPACSQERAMAELFECSGTQFDPELVEQFDEFCREDQTTVRGEAASRWLRSLDSTTVNSYWESQRQRGGRRSSPPSMRCSRANSWTPCTTPWCSSTPPAESCCGTAGRNG